MNKSLTPQSVAAIFGFLVLGAVVALGAYFQFSMTKVDSAPPVRGAFSLSIFTTELKPGGIFDKTKSLTDVKAPNQSPAPVVTYSPGDLGKDDITQYN